jgi:hypothetical protein
MSGDHMAGRMFQVWNANGPGALDAVELSSSANGMNWSHPVQVTSGNAPNIQYINAAVATANGRVFVSFGRRNLNKPNIIQQELTWSSDGGKTFATPIALGPPSNLTWAAVAGGKFPGDYHTGPGRRGLVRLRQAAEPGCRLPPDPLRGDPAARNGARAGPGQPGQGLARPGPRSAGGLPGRGVLSAAG